MVLLPLGNGAQSRWALIHTIIEERTATGIRISALAAILNEDDLSSGYNNLLNIERALVDALPGIDRSKPPHIEIELEDGDHELPINVVRAVSFRHAKPLRFYTLGKGIPLSKLAFQVFDARAALRMPRIAVTSAPSLLVSAEWGVRTSLTLRAEAQGGKPPKNAIAIDQDYNIPELGLSVDHELWCEFCQAMALLHMQWPAERETQDDIPFQHKFAGVLWDLRSYKDNSAFDVLSSFAERSESSHALLHQAVKQNVDWACRKENSDHFEKIVLPMVVACRENAISGTPNRQFESIVMEQMGKPLLNGLFREPVDGAVLNLMLRNHNFLAARTAQQRTSQDHAID